MIHLRCDKAFIKIIEVQYNKELVMNFSRAFPGSNVEVTNAFATEDQLVIEFTGSGTNTGPVHLPTGDIPATGWYSELQFYEVIQCRNRKIVSFRIYFDNMTLLQNLGLVPGIG